MLTHYCHVEICAKILQKNGFFTIHGTKKANYVKIARLCPFAIHVCTVFVERGIYENERFDCQKKST